MSDADTCVPGSESVEGGASLGKRRRPITQKGGAPKGENATESSDCERSVVEARRGRGVQRCIDVHDVRPSGCELPQVIIQVHLQELAPFPERHLPEEWMRFPGRVSSRVPRGRDDLQQLRLFVCELKSLRMWDFEALGNAETYGLLRQPIHRDPLADASGDEVAFVRHLVKPKRAAARQIEMVEHLVYGHQILVPLLLREKATPIHLF
jgi:hypothetical protein